MDAWVDTFLSALALPRVGLSAVFVVSFLSATLLPLGSEAVVLGLVKLSPWLLWPAVLVATLGNTLGGALTWWMGFGAERAFETLGRRVPPNPRAVRWLERWGPRACLLSWLPLIGDPLCAVAGWLKLAFWPCVFYMAVGKFARYASLTAALLWLWPAQSLQ